MGHGEPFSAQLLDQQQEVEQRDHGAIADEHDDPENPEHENAQSPGGKDEDEMGCGFGPERADGHTIGRLEDITAADPRIKAGDVSALKEFHEREGNQKPYREHPAPIVVVDLPRKDTAKHGSLQR